MNCKEFLDCLDAYLDGEMTQPERQAFLAHAQAAPLAARNFAAPKRSAKRSYR